MTIIHKGIRRKTSDVTEDYGLAYYAQNVRFRRVGEMGRRGGIGKTDMAQQAGPVLLIGCGSYYEPYVIQVVGSTAISTPDPLTLWADPILIPPDGDAGEPEAPIIQGITPSPASGAPYVVGQVSFLATIVYDGLSGPLTFSWTNFQVGPAIPTAIVTNANPGIFEFGGACTPGQYSYAGIGGLTVTTALHGFSTTLAPDDYQVG
jgi:hypothetical protein